MDGVDKVHIYNWLVKVPQKNQTRRSIADSHHKVRDSDTSAKEGTMFDLNDSLAKLGPLHVVHIGRTRPMTLSVVY